MDQDNAAEASGARRSGRGVLSSIEMLPEICDEDIAWANAELRERRMPQTEILRQFNARLADRGVKGVSKGAFSRYSVRLAVAAKEAEQKAISLRSAISAVSAEAGSRAPADPVELQRLVLVGLLHSDRLNHRTIKQACDLLISLLKDGK